MLSIVKDSNTTNVGLGLVASNPYSDFIIADGKFLEFEHHRLLSALTVFPQPRPRGILDEYMRQQWDKQSTHETRFAAFLRR
jgi:hypothetical protein